MGLLSHTNNTDGNAGGQSRRRAIAANGLRVISIAAVSLAAVASASHWETFTTMTGSSRLRHEDHGRAS
jgi:hypothetical protein